MIVYLVVYIGGSKGEGAWTQASPVQYLSFSCSFWQNSCQIIGFCPKFRSWLWEILDPPLFYFLEKQLRDFLVPDPDHHHYLSDIFDFFEYLIRLQVIVAGSLESAN